MDGPETAAKLELDVTGAAFLFRRIFDSDAARITAVCERDLAINIAFVFVARHHRLIGGKLGIPASPLI